MDEKSLYDLLENYRNAIDFLSQRLEEMDQMIHDYAKQDDERFHKLEEVIYKDLLEPNIKAEHERKFKEFADKFGSRLEGYNGALRALEGDNDFDLVKEAFDDFSNYKPAEGEDMPTDEAYVDKFIQNVEDQINGIKEAMNVPMDTDVELTSTEEGTELKVDGQTVASTEEPAEEEKSEDAEPKEEVKEEVKEEEPAEDEESDELTPEEYAELEKEINALKR